MLKIIYTKSPVFIQNIFVTVENIFVLYKKYGYLPFLNPMNRIVNEVENLNINYTDEELVEHLNSFIKYSKNNTKYYTEDQYKEIDDLSELVSIPFLKKIVLRENTDDFYSKKITSSNSRTLFTSGSTGSPMEIKVSVKDLQFRFKLLLKTMLDFGYEYDKPSGRITGHDICDDNSIYRKDYLNNQYFLSAFHISDLNIKKYFDVITSNNIKALDGYPSAIYTLAKLFEQHNLHISCIDTIYTTAEKLHKHQKEKIEEVFSCKVFDYYGSNEQSIFIYTCKNGNLHVSNKTGYLEVLDHYGNRTKKGKVGKMIITSLTSHFMPLIRYEIGDACSVSNNQNCSCGSTGLVIDEIIGRDEDIFKTVDGIYITRFSVVLKCSPKDVVESQLVLSNHKMSTVLYYTSTNEIDDNKFIDFKNALISKIGNKYQVECKRVDRITKSSRGKVRAVIIEN